MSLRFSEDWLEQRNTLSASWKVSKKPTKPTPLKKSQTQKSTAKKSMSPHLRALNALIRKPELEKGNGEHYSQVRFFYYFEINNPEIYKSLHATPNGGYRTKLTASAMKAEGQKKGYPDISLDMARQGFHGLRIELKHGNNRLTPEQKEWRVLLEEQGYKYVECRSTQEAIDAVLEYINN